MENKSPKYVSYKEMRTLRKEYNTKINPLSKWEKVWNVIVSVAQVIGFLGAIVHLISLCGIELGIFDWIGLAMFGFWVVIQCINLPYGLKRNKSFDEWLKTEKKIVNQ